jgi:hypothetical protein
VASKKSQYVEVGERIRRAHEMYSLPIQASPTVDRRDSTRNPLFLDVRSELLYCDLVVDRSTTATTVGGGDAHPTASSVLYQSRGELRDTPHRVECSCSSAGPGSPYCVECPSHDPTRPFCSTRCSRWPLRRQSIARNSQLIGTIP